MKRGAVNKLVDELTVKLWNHKDYSVASEIFSDDFVDHDPMPGQGTNRQAFVATVQFLHMSCQDLQVSNDSVHYDSKDNVVTIRWTATGSGKNSLMRYVLGTEPISMKGIDVFKVKDGSFTEHWGEVDASVFFK